MAIDPKTLPQRKTDDDGGDLHQKIAALQMQVDALLQVKTSSGDLSDDKLETILLRVAQVSAEAQERAINPSNKSHPGISVFSYPEGDRARPRAFKCPMFWVGYDLHEDTTTAEEIELFNRAEPGIYEFKRTDGSVDRMTVTGQQGADGKLTRLLFDFQVKENRETLPSMSAQLRSAFNVPTAEQVELEKLRAQVESLRRAGVAA